MAWGMIAGAVAAPLIGGLVTSAFGGGSSSHGASGGGGPAQTADPFASQRPQYQDQLSKLMSDPNSFQMSSAAKFAEKEGMDATSAQWAARGLNGSGAMEVDLTKYATGFAGQQYQQQMSNLMTLSGATSGSPATAGQMQGQQQQQDSSALGTFGSTVGRAVVGSPGVQNFLGGNTGSSMGAGIEGASGMPGGSYF